MDWVPAATAHHWESGPPAPTRDRQSSQWGRRLAKKDCHFVHSQVQYNYI